MNYRERISKLKISWIKPGGTGRSWVGSGGGNGDRQFLKPGRTIPLKNVKRGRKTRDNQVPDIFLRKGDIGHL